MIHPPTYFPPNAEYLIRQVIHGLIDLSLGAALWAFLTPPTTRGELK